MSVSAYQNDLYVIRESRGGVITLLWEYRLDGEVRYRMPRGRVSGWRRAVFKYLARKLEVGDEVWGYDRGSRLSVLIRILPEIRDVGDAYRAADIIADAGLEEVAFWGWKLNELGRRAAKAWKAMYGVH
ncbi:MAG: hypothetical protein ACP5RJ_07845 [Conexivisphaera sp.]|jgi:hypothetical protein|nr:hypothetical protein [Conexivisphaerales archaeon]